MPKVNIRPECLRPADEGWIEPTGEEVRAVLVAAGFSGGQAARILGLGPQGNRSVRRWAGVDGGIPYAAWALLCDFAGQGQIWKKT